MVFEAGSNVELKISRRSFEGFVYTMLKVGFYKAGKCLCGMAAQCSGSVFNQPANYQEGNK